MERKNSWLREAKQVLYALCMENGLPSTDEAFVYMIERVAIAMHLSEQQERALEASFTMWIANWEEGEGR